MDLGLKVTKISPNPQGVVQTSMENMPPFPGCQPSNIQEITFPILHTSHPGPPRVSAGRLQVSRTARDELVAQSKVGQRHQLAGCHKKERTCSCSGSACCPASPAKPTQELITHNGGFLLGPRRTDSPETSVCGQGQLGKAIAMSEANKEMNP
jgi:hypothetical protein